MRLGLTINNCAREIIDLDLQKQISFTQMQYAPKKYERDFIFKKIIY